MNIHNYGNFNGEYLAIFRPRMRTYNIIKWNNFSQIWIANHEQFQNMTVHRSNQGSVRGFLNVLNNERIRFTSDGFFIRNENAIIPIIHTNASSLPRSYRRVNITAEQAAENVYNDARELWTAEPEVPPQELQAQIQQKLPQRIARIIAEDALRNKEVCGITMEPIIPENSSVTSCFHIFETTAIDRWLQSHTSCPLCNRECSVTKV